MSNFFQDLKKIAYNGLQAWEVADESELRSIGKIEFFRVEKSECYQKFGNFLCLLLTAGVCCLPKNTVKPIFHTR